MAGAAESILVNIETVVDTGLVRVPGAVARHRTVGVTCDHHRGRRHPIACRALRQAYSACAADANESTGYATGQRGAEPSKTTPKPPTFAADLPRHRANQYRNETAVLVGLNRWVVRVRFLIGGFPACPERMSLTMTVDDVRTGCHWLLLRLAGHLPDDLVAQCRQWVAKGQLTAVGRAVGDAICADRLPLTTADANLLAELLAAGGVDSVFLSDVEVTDVDQMPLCGFVPGQARLDAVLGLTPDIGLDGSGVDPRPEDGVDDAALAAVSDEPAVRGLWRVWRYPCEGSRLFTVRRVYLLECDANADLPVITVRTQERLAAAGEIDPQVEVYPVRVGLPRYQRLARSGGTLMWARDPDPGIQIVRLYDEVDENGPRMAPEHPSIEEPEAGRLATYLRQGEPLLLTTGTMDDVVDRTRTGAVPMSFRTDGVWIWSDASAYYLEQYRLSPDPRLVAHARERNYQSPEIDGAGRFRAMAVLTAPTPDAPE